MGGVGGGSLGQWTWDLSPVSTWWNVSQLE